MPRQRQQSMRIIMSLALVVAAMVLLAPQSANAAPAAKPIGPITYDTPAGRLVVGWSPAGVRSASGCNQDVCEQITGFSNYISKWATQGFNEGPVCSWPDYHYNGTIVATSDILCVDDAGVFYSTWYPNRKFTPNPAYACASWWGIGGYPCEKVSR